MTADTPAMTITALRPSDLPAALALQAESYPPFLVEAEAAFASRMTLAATHCLAARRDGVLLGYLLAHGWAEQSPPAVGMVLAEGVPSEVLFIHDLAVSSAGRGLGIGATLIGHALQRAARDGLRRAELIAVEGAAAYWQRLGFTAAATSGALAEKVATYGPHACWMARDIPSSG